jgi:hypothetical protein
VLNEKSRKCVYSVKSFYFYCLSLFEYSFVYEIIINTVSPMLFSSLCCLVPFLSHEKYVVFLKKNRNMFRNDFILTSISHVFLSSVEQVELTVVEVVERSLEFCLLYLEKLSHACDDFALLVSSC